MFEMKRQLTWSKLKVGAVVTLALAVLLLTMLFAGNIEDILSPKAIITAYIQDVRGLRKGAPVWVSGIEIGFVKDMRLQTEHGTVVTMAIEKKALRYLRKDSEANVMTLGLLGDKYIEISSGTMKAGQMQEGDVIEGKAQLEIKDLVDASSESLAKVTVFIDKIGSFVEKIEKNEGTVGRLLNDPTLYQNLSESSARLASLLKRIDKSGGSMDLFVKDPSLYRTMLSAASSLDRFGKKVNGSSGTLGKLIEDPQLYDDLKNASQRLTGILSTVEEKKGTAHILLEDEQLASDLKETVKGLKETIAELNNLTKDIRSEPKKYFKFSLF
jgi:phospholipid/cholesterol/gamma-HCH transport system substrate-binding protein